LLLGVTRRSVLQHPIPQRECDPTTLIPVDGEVSPGGDDTVKPPPTPIIPTLRPGAAVQTHLLPLLPLLSEEYQPSPLTLLPPLSSVRQVAGEVIHASSGFVHIALMLYLARRSPTPATGPTSTSYRSLASPLPATLIPLGLLLLSRTLRPSSNPQTAMTPLQAQLEQSRDRELAWWFVKGAIYERWTKPKMDRWIEWGSGDSRWKRWMGLGLISGLLQDHQKLVEELYYCKLA
jgi:peroxin-16